MDKKIKRQRTVGRKTFEKGQLVCLKCGGSKFISREEYDKAPRILRELFQAYAKFLS